MYEFLLALHSWIRWIALVAAIAATFAAFGIGADNRGRGTADRWGLVLVGALDLQLLLGLVMYFGASPNMSAIRDNFGAAMSDPAARFWAVEHASLMLVALVAAHVGRVLARKAATPAAARTRLLVCYGLATIAMLAGTPWPGMPAGRPLFRF